jgi:hypothetical protein
VGIRLADTPVFVDQSVELEVLFVDRYGSAAVSVDEFFERHRLPLARWFT